MYIVDRWINYHLPCDINYYLLFEKITAINKRNTEKH